MKFIKGTKSICPEDLRALDAELWEIDGQVIMRKTCPDHGSFEDVYWSDYGEYVRASRFRDEGFGLLNAREPRLGCPYLPLLLAKSYTPLRSLTEGRLWRGWFTVAVMHFMDPYNFDLERAQNCALHYGVPDNETKARLIPFCAMNCIHRPRIEKQLGIPAKEEEEPVATT